MLNSLQLLVDWTKYKLLHFHLWPRTKARCPYESISVLKRNDPNWFLEILQIPKADSQPEHVCKVLLFTSLVSPLRPPGASQQLLIYFAFLEVVFTELG